MSPKPPGPGADRIVAIVAVALLVCLASVSTLWPSRADSTVCQEITIEAPAVTPP